MNGWIDPNDRWNVEYTAGCMDRWVDVRMDEWKDGRNGGCMDGWMGGMTDGWLD